MFRETLAEGDEGALHLGPERPQVYSDISPKEKERMKGIKREFSIVRIPQQNRVAERKNKTLIEVARTMLVDSLLPIPFWAEEVNTTCYVQNRVLVTKLHNKTPYELLLGRSPSIGFMRPFGCPITILNTLDPLGKFVGKADEGFLVGYSINIKVDLKNLLDRQHGKSESDSYYPSD
nr:putative ribonuclease H-like domain-containing protein [Tanacetum cinerariifolium]